MVLRKRNVWLNNGFETLADVTLRPSAHGTQVAITWRSHYFVAAFTTLWLGLVVLIAGFGAVLSGKPEASAFVLVFLLFGFGFMALGRLLARPDRAVLLEFIAEVTDGSPYPDATLPPM
jgi:cytochrome c biogenesis protein CcdA